MLRRRTLSGILILLAAAGRIPAQTSASQGSSQTQEIAKASTAAKDPVDLKLQDALRERDAIIRNLLERVNELEWRVNGGYTTPTKVDDRPALPSAHVINSVVSTSTYDTTETTGDRSSRSGSDCAWRIAAAFRNARDR